MKKAGCVSGRRSPSFQSLFKKPLEALRFNRTTNFMQSMPDLSWCLLPLDPAPQRCGPNLGCGDLRRRSWEASQRSLLSEASGTHGGQWRSCLSGVGFAAIKDCTTAGGQQVPGNARAIGGWMRSASEQFDRRPPKSIAMTIKAAAGRARTRGRCVPLLGGRGKEQRRETAARLGRVGGPAGAVRVSSDRRREWSTEGCEPALGDRFHAPVSTANACCSLLQWCAPRLQVDIGGTYHSRRKPYTEYLWPALAAACQLLAATSRTNCFLPQHKSDSRNAEANEEGNNTARESSAPCPSKS